MAIEADYLQYADDEAYLFGVVSPRFQSQGWLNAFDMMTIARWKAERAHIHFARRLVSKGAPTLEEGARTLTQALARADSDEARFSTVCADWAFPLATGSALLTVCFSTSFTVYDVRVCGELEAFHDLANRTKLATQWRGYLEYVTAVKRAAPSGLTLRQCDHWLWGRSRYKERERWLSAKGKASALTKPPRAAR